MTAPEEAQDGPREPLRLGIVEGTGEADEGFEPLPFLTTSSTSQRLELTRSSRPTSGGPSGNLVVRVIDVPESDPGGQRAILRPLSKCLIIDDLNCRYVSRSLWHYC